MPHIAAGLGFGGHRPQYRFIGERLEQFVMAGASLVHPRYDRVDDGQVRAWSEPQRRQTGTGLDVPVIGDRGFQRPHDGRADGDDAAATCAGPRDQVGGRWRNLVWLVERQAAVEIGIAGRRETRRVGDRRESGTSFLDGLQHRPVQQEAGRRRFERHGTRRHARPRYPRSPAGPAHRHTAPAGRQSPAIARLNRRSR